MFVLMVGVSVWVSECFLFWHEQCVSLMLCGCCHCDYTLNKLFLSEEMKTYLIRSIQRARELKWKSRWAQLATCDIRIACHFETNIVLFSFDGVCESRVQTVYLYIYIWNVLYVWGKMCEQTPVPIGTRIHSNTRWSS